MKKTHILYLNFFLVILILGCSHSAFTKHSKNNEESAILQEEPEVQSQEKPASSNSAPLIQNLSLNQSIDTDGVLKLSFTVNAVDPDNDPFKCTIEQMNTENSAWVNLVDNNGNGCLSTFRVSEYGKLVFNITVTDDKGLFSIMTKIVPINSIGLYINSIPEISLIEPHENDLFVRGEAVKFIFSISDDGIELCEPSEQNNPWSIELLMHNSIEEKESVIKLDSTCSTTITLPDVISNFPLVFTYYDPFGLYNVTMVDIVTVNEIADNI